MRNEEFDILGRIIRSVEPVTGTIYEYEYTSGNSRTIIITNETNKSNFKTIKKQILKNNEYVDFEVEELGETYHILKKYNDRNKEIFYQQTNLKTGKIHKKKTMWKEDKPYIWTSEYDGDKNIGFFMDKKIITGLTKNT